MKKLTIALSLTALGTLAGCNNKPAPPPPPTPTTTTPTAAEVKPVEPPKPPPPAPLTAEEKPKALYGFGVLLAQRTPVAQLSLTDAELAEVVKGMKDVTGGKEPALKLDEYGPKVDQLLRQSAEERTESEKKKGAEFLEKAAKEKGATKTASGLVITIEKAGEGAAPKATDTVTVNYRGTLIDGTEFDSSYKRNAPATFPLGGVIKCWTEGVQLLKPGGKAKLVCPPDIGYGDRGAGANIPGGATLIFEVELLEVKAPAPAPAPGAPAMPSAPTPAPQNPASPH